MHLSLDSYICNFPEVGVYFRRDYDVKKCDQFSSSVSCITIRKRCLSGATRISLFLARTLKKVMSFIGSRSLTTDLAFFAKSVTAVAIYCGVVLEVLSY